MKIRILSLTLATAVAAAFVFPFLASQKLQAQEEEAAATSSDHQLWEYRALRIQDRRQSGALNRDIGAREAQSEDTLNLLGAKGWELVAVRNDGSSEPVFYFKRPKAN
ncbi:MAG: hypothetical protein AAF591_02055 [Verrucomicrobiota bacterium]